MASEYRRRLEAALPKLKQECGGFRCVACEQTRSIAAEQIDREIGYSAGMAVIAAARCIRHWHDTGRDGEGMIVSAAHVRLLWEALAKFDAAVAVARGQRAATVAENATVHSPGDSGRGYTVIHCSACGKDWPNPYVVIADPCQCECDNCANPRHLGPCKRKVQSPGSTPSSDGSMEKGRRAGIYVASKVKHAETWKHLRSEGWPITATWIDEAGEGETSDHADLAQRCIREAVSAERVVLYCEPGDILKGALIEVGAALACGVPVYCVGDCESLSKKTFSKHPLWHDCATLADAAPSGQEDQK